MRLRTTLLARHRGWDLGEMAGALQSPILLQAMDGMWGWRWVQDSAKFADRDFCSPLEGPMGSPMKEAEYRRLAEMLGDWDILSYPLDYETVACESAGETYTSLQMDIYMDEIGKAVPEVPVLPAVPAPVVRHTEDTTRKLYQELIKSVPRLHKQHIANYANIINHQRKMATVCARELRRGLSRTSKTNPSLKNKRINKELLRYVGRLQREGRERAKKEETEKEQRKKSELAMKEELRQKRKFNYLMSQTEAFANFFLNRENKEADGCEDGLQAAQKHLEYLREFDNPGGSHPAEQVYVHQNVEQPRLLKTQLREYQLKGLNWLVSLYNQGINGILADDMGLGKTVQTIALLGYLAETEDIRGPFLVITPSSTLHNWENEISRFVPDFRTVVYYGNVQERAELRKQIRKANVVVTSYQVAVSDESVFRKVLWQYMILDEAQAIKNISSQRWRILLSFKARNRCLLTGTPIQNNLQELWSLLHFIMPTLFDSLNEFTEWFTSDNNIDEAQVDKLHTILKPFMLRRHKDDIKDEIGSKEIVHLYCDFSPRQRVLYDEVLATGLPGEGGLRSRECENVIMHLKKICNHPDLFEKPEPSSSISFSVPAAGRLVDPRSCIKRYIPFWAAECRPGQVTDARGHFAAPGIVHADPARMNAIGLLAHLQNAGPRIPLELLGELDRKRRRMEGEARRFSFVTERVSDRGMTSNLAAERELCSLGAWRPANSTREYHERMTYLPPATTFISDSGKLAEVDKLLDELRADGHRPLIYFQMTRMMDLFEEYLNKKGYSYLRLDGSSKVSLRKELVREWQTKEIFIFMLSTRAGGVGLNLTAGDTVIFYDSDWNPTVDQQAMDRVHRLGQTKKVTVYRLITRGSIEERVMERASKKDVMQRIVIKGKIFEGN